MKIHHIEIKEEIRDHDGRREYVVADYPKDLLRILTEGEAEDMRRLEVKTCEYEVIAWHSPGEIKPTYFGIEKSKFGLFNHLAKISTEQIDRFIEDRLEAGERRTMERLRKAVEGMKKHDYVEGDKIGQWGRDGFNEALEAVLSLLRPSSDRYAH